MNTKYVTVDKKYAGIRKPVLCLKNDDLKDMSIQNNCFLLIILTAGSATFAVNGETFTAVAPSFVCFDEKADPVLLRSHSMENYAVYFHPTFLNVNMTFERIRAYDYKETALSYDMFLLKPFLEHRRNIDIPQSYTERLSASMKDMIFELSEQRDEFWSCRGRSCFIEIMILLERAYSSLLGEGAENDLSTRHGAQLQAAVQFIEANYANDISYEDIVHACGMNHTDFAAIFKEQYNITAFKYLMDFRIEIAKKLVAFTDVPLKDIAQRCGFKTVQHFTRVFKELIGETPAAYRRSSVNARINGFKNRI